MDEHIDYEKIFTPQGMLGHVSKNPNLDFLMNIFNIPRVYSVWHLERGATHHGRRFPGTLLVRI